MLWIEFSNPWKEKSFHFHFFSFHLFSGWGHWLGMRVWSLFFCPWLRLCLNIQSTCLTLSYNTKLTNISKYSYTTKMSNISKNWWTWFSDWPHRFHLPHCGNRYRTLCHCLPPVFQGLTFGLLVSFVFIIVSLSVFVRICLFLSATDFPMFYLAVGYFFCCWLFYKVGRRSLAKIFTRPDFPFSSITNCGVGLNQLWNHILFYFRHDMLLHFHHEYFNILISFLVQFISAFWV